MQFIQSFYNSSRIASGEVLQDGESEFILNFYFQFKPTILICCMEPAPVQVPKIITECFRLDAAFNCTASRYAYTLILGSGTVLCINPAVAQLTCLRCCLFSRP